MNSPARSETSRVTSISPANSDAGTRLNNLLACNGVTGASLRADSAAVKSVSWCGAVRRCSTVFMRRLRVKSGWLRQAHGSFGGGCGRIWVAEGGERWRRGGGQETRPPQGRGGRKENKNLKVGLSRIESDRSRARTFQQERAEKTEGGKPQQFVSKSRRME